MNIGVKEEAGQVAWWNRRIHDAVHERYESTTKDLPQDLGAQLAKSLLHDFIEETGKKWLFQYVARRFKIQSLPLNSPQSRALGEHHRSSCTTP